MSKIEKEIASRFKCPKCHNTGANVKSLAMAGTGTSKIFNIQHNRYIFASCNDCGYTEIYDLDMLSGGKDTVGNIEDVSNLRRILSTTCCRNKQAPFQQPQASTQKQYTMLHQQVLI